MARSKRLKPTSQITRTGVQVIQHYCRKCMATKKPADFYRAVDTFLDANGLMSVCKDCIGDIYNRAFQREHSIEGAILLTCRIVNVRYEPRMVESLKNTILKREAEDKEIDLGFGHYLRLLNTTNRTTRLIEELPDGDMTFQEPSLAVSAQPLSDEQVEVDIKTYLENFWGKGLEFEDYDYLERELAEWQRTTKCDTQPALVLIREICFIQNQIRKDRILGKNTSSLVKQLQDIMKNSALTPAQQSAASGKKSLDAFGVWVKEIEQKTPAEWFEEQDKFKDMDGLKQYGEDFIVRPIRNFIGVSRDFNVEGLPDLQNAIEEDEGG